VGCKKFELPADFSAGWNFFKERKRIALHFKDKLELKNEKVHTYIQNLLANTIFDFIFTIETRLTIVSKMAVV